ncbi:MAG: uroporphyrinogen decarboxylase [Acidimicrobiia bacterium]|nr:uroporphyrinogen decarboxylase [Acidimicrobiia bacterium]
MSTVLGVAAHPDITNDTFLRACRGLPVERVPVWFMRQAGRSLPEYRALRGKGAMLDTIARPDVATEITLQPVRRYGVDAAILYSDIVVPTHAIGFGIDIVPGIGPVAEQPFRETRDLDRLRPLNPETDTPYVLETVDNLVAELNVPLIAFAGAPFTVASYLIEGGPSRSHNLTKQLMHNNPSLWHALLDRLADLAITFISSQLDAGATAFQLFDSWAGVLTPNEYQHFVLPASQKIFSELHNKHADAPGIHFGVETTELLELLAKAGADVVGLDWRIHLDDARKRLGPHVAVQGNLDPATVLAPWPIVSEQATNVLNRNARQPGHVFNLGHGVLPESNPEMLEKIVHLVHEYKLTP